MTDQEKKKDTGNTKEKYTDNRWTEDNAPVNYIIGVTPGFSQFEQGEEKLTNMGLARKIMKAARFGFDFCQIDYEALSEMFEADIKEQVAHIKNSQGNIDIGRKFEVGLHLQTDLDLCIAGAYEWKIMHDRLTKGAFSAKRLVEAKYFLFHTSSRIRPHVTFDVGQQEPRVALYSFDGTNLAQFMQEVDDGKFVDPARGTVTCPTSTPDGNKFVSMRDWFMGRFITILFNAMGAPADVSTVAFFDDFMLEQNGTGFQAGYDLNVEKYKKLTDELNEEMKTRKKNISAAWKNEQTQLLMQKQYYQQKNMVFPAQFEIRLKEIEADIQALNSGSMEEGIQQDVLREKPHIEEGIKAVSTVRSYLMRTEFKDVFAFWRRHGSEAEEQVAYRVIAKYMWLTHDPIWADIVGMQYDPDQITWRNEIGYEYYSKDKKSQDKNGPTLKILVEKLITAVAAKYIQGHLFVKHEKWSMKADDKDLTSHISVYEYTKQANLKIYLETAMPPQGQEGQLRIMSASDHVKVVKNLDMGKITSYCLDFEHLTVNYIYVNEDVGSLPDGDAKYITMVHINAPRPIMGAHAPVENISRDMQVIYRWLLLMRQKGMKNAYLIWEMGSYGVKESAVAFRKLMAELNKDTDPLHLPKEFYGLDEMFEQQQWVNMREHAYDALKGLIANPEEDHGLLSTEAVKKNKLNEWLAGRYK